MHVPPPHSGVSYDTDQVHTDHLTPVNDNFCPDEEYYPAEKAADITHPTIPQLDGSSEYSPVLPPLSSIYGQLYRTDLGLEARRKEQEREREKDLDDIKRMIAASCRF